MGVNVAIHVNAPYVPSPDGFYQEGKLHEWSATIWGMEQGRWFGLWGNGHTNGELWEWIRRYARKFKELTIWSWRLWPTWCIADGRREVSEGRLILDISGDKPEGLFVAADPPTIIVCKTPSGCRLKMVDLANFGIEPEDYGVKDSRGALSATKQAANDLHNLCQDYDMGIPQATAAAQAWWTYKTKHQPKARAEPPQGPSVSRLEESAYFGGRCEAGYLGSTDRELWHLDVSSMYTAIGRTAPFPRVHLGTWDNLADSQIYMDWDETLQIADVTLKTDMAWYPADEIVRANHLHVPEPYASEDARIIYPTGHFRTVLCGPELALAMDSDHIYQWHRVQLYKPSQLMAHWSAWALFMRDDVKNGPMKHLSRCAKKIINSLPGKWGQRLKVWRDMPDSPEYETGVIDKNAWFTEHGKHPLTGQLTQFRTIAGHCQYLDKDELAPGSCPAVAAFWTSYGRAALLGLINLANGWEGQHVYYYDTDSLIVDSVGFDRLAAIGVIGRGEPGKLRVLTKANDLQILGIRKYFFAGKWHVAGLTEEEIRHEGFAQQMWRKHVGRSAAVHADKMADSPEDSPFSTYKHGVPTAGGWVRPFNLGGHVNDKARTERAEPSTDGGTVESDGRG